MQPVQDGLTINMLDSTSAGSAFEAILKVDIIEVYSVGIEETYFGKGWYMRSIKYGVL